MVLTGSSKRPILQLILVMTVIRCLIAHLINLGNDEVYYFTYAVLPAWNHFDHPPLVGVFIRIFTLNLIACDEIMVRLPGIVGAAVNTWLIARCGELIKSRQTGIIAAILYNTSIYTSVIAGIFILPDSVQLVFWLAALYSMLRCTGSDEPTIVRKHLLLIGLWTGLAVMSKVHGVFLRFGFLAFLTTRKHELFKNPHLYTSLALTAILISPILFWNISNDFITWRFHSERVTVTEQGINFQSFFRTTIGQILYANPVQIVLFAMAGKDIARKQNFLNAPYLSLLLWSGIPIIICTITISLFRDTLPHWSGPGFVALMLIAAAWLEERASTPVHHRILNCCVGLMAFVFIAGPLIICCYPGTMSSKKFPMTGSGDATLDIYGWDKVLPAFEKIRNDNIRQGTMSAQAPLLVHKWFPGAHIYYHVAYPLRMRLVGAGNIHDLHQFCWLNKIYGQVSTGSDAWYIAPSNYFTDPAAQYAGQFKSIEKAGTIAQRRGGRIARYWFVYRLKHATRPVGCDTSL